MNITEWSKWVACADNHGDIFDQNACEAFFRFIAAFNPSIRIHLGDAFDLRPLRRKASDSERREYIGPDIAAGMKFLETMRPTHFLLGNHEGRLDRLVEESAGAASELSATAIKDIRAFVIQIGAKLYPYHKRDGVCRIGNTNFLHGYYVGETAAKRHALVYGPCIFGHVHTIAEAPVPGLYRRVARSIGALCELDQGYNSATVSSLSHAHGWAYGVVNDRTGEVHTWQAERIGGKWITPTDIVEI